MLAGCSAKVEAKAGNEGVEASAEYGDGQKSNQWDGDNETDVVVAEGVDGPAGRLVEGHDGGDRPLATLPGFRQFDDGTSRVFIELSGAVDIKERQSPSLLVYRFEGVHVPERVNTLSLPTMHFSTPVQLVEVREVNGAAELMVHLRQPVKPKAHLKRTDGGTVLSLDFPKYRPHRQDTDANVNQQLQAADAEDAKKGY